MPRSSDSFYVRYVSIVEENEHNKQGEREWCCLMRRGLDQPVTACGGIVDHSCGQRPSNKKIRLG
jgi:hypothetical protein